MQRLIAFAKGLFRGSASAETGKLGSKGDPIRQVLFGSQTLKEQVQRIRLNGSSGPLSRIVDASKLGDSGKRKEAIGDALNLFLSTRILGSQSFIQRTIGCGCKLTYRRICRSDVSFSSWMTRSPPMPRHCSREHTMRSQRNIRRVSTTAARQSSTASVTASASASSLPIPSQCFCQLCIRALAFAGTGSGIAELKSWMVST